MSLCVLAQVCAHILVHVSVPVTTKLTSEPQRSPCLCCFSSAGDIGTCCIPSFFVWVLGVTSGLHASGTSTFQTEALTDHEDAVCTWFSASGFQPLAALLPASHGAGGKGEPAAPEGLGS